MKSRGIFEKVPGSGEFWIRYADANGRIRREKAGTWSAARDLYHKRKTEVLQGRKLPETLRRAPVSFREVARDGLAYSRTHKRSYRHDEYRMAVLLDWFGSRAAESITAQEIEQKFGQKAWAPATCNRYRALLSFVYRIAVASGKLVENPVRKLAHRRESNGRIRFLDTDEDAALRRAIRQVRPEGEAEFDLALHTGIRRGEQYRLRWNDVDFRLGLLTVMESKNGQCRSIPLNEIASAALEKLRKWRDSTGYVVRGMAGERERDWQRWFEAAVKKAGIEDFCWHDLRHTFASRLAMAGVPVRTIAELLGHKTLAMTMRYAHLAPAHLRGAVECLTGQNPTDTRTDTSTVAVVRPGSARIQ